MEESEKIIITVVFTHIVECSTDISFFANNKLLDTGTSKAKEVLSSAFNSEIMKVHVWCEVIHWGKNISVFKRQMKNNLSNLRYMFYPFSAYRRPIKVTLLCNRCTLTKICAPELPSRSDPPFLCLTLCPGRDPCRASHPGVEGWKGDKGWGSWSTPHPVLAGVGGSSAWAVSDNRTFFPPLAPRSPLPEHLRSVSLMLSTPL